MAGFFEPGPRDPQPLSFGGGVHIQPAFDVVELLPTAAADKLRMLRQRAADAHAVVPPFEQIREASMAKIAAANALRRLTDHPQNAGFGLKPQDRQVVAAQRTLDKATADFKRLQALQAERTTQWQAASGALQAVESWLRDGRPRDTMLEDAEVEPVKLNKGETVTDGIERHRRRIRELRADQRRIHAAPFPSSLAKSQMRQQVEALAQRGQPDVSLLIELDREIIWPSQRVQSTVYNAQPGAVGFAEVSDAAALFAWAFKDQLIKKLDAAIDDESDDKSALDHAERQKQEAIVLGDLLEVERTEASLVWQAQAQNLPCEHRSDIDPRALLGVVFVAAPREVASGTSSEHGYTIMGVR